MKAESSEVGPGHCPLHWGSAGLGAGRRLSQACVTAQGGTAVTSLPPALCTYLLGVPGLQRVFAVIKSLFDGRHLERKHWQGGGQRVRVGGVTQPTLTYCSRVGH